MCLYLVGYQTNLYQLALVKVLDSGKSLQSRVCYLDSAEAVCVAIVTVSLNCCSMDLLMLNQLLLVYLHVYKCIGIVYNPQFT